MRLMWRIFLSFFACILLALAAAAWASSYATRRFYQEQVAVERRQQAELLAHVLAEPIETAPETVDPRCKEFGRLVQARVTVVLPDGRVLGDSEGTAADMEPHDTRPEVAQALSGHAGRNVRFSDTLRRTLLYVAVPAWRGDRVVAAVRVSVPIVLVDWALHHLYRQVLAGALVAALLAAAASFWLARRISRPLDEMRRAAERLAAGELSVRVALPHGPEPAALARALNRMAAQLNERMAVITRQRDEQQAVFASMVEGVLAVDSEFRVLDINAAAARLLCLDPARVRGRSLQEAIRHPDLQQFVTSIPEAEGPLESEIVLYDQSERCLQLHGAPLADAAGRPLGALVVLHDITRIKRLETMRRDFVANVSHELKTPITALKGCVDTLADPAARRPPDLDRFVAMMGRQVDRLGAIVEDLLSLSRIEHDAERQCVPLEPGPVAAVLRRAAQTAARAAAAKSMTVSVECPEDLNAPMNPALLEQAVSNLVDNAVKYSGDRTRVTVRGAARGGRVEIQVSDEGPGIERQHLPRLFERFYRVDQARSRTLGGTGLGLAIVKHIALAHHGSVTVASAPGQGSTFTLRIPLAPGA